MIAAPHEMQPRAPLLKRADAARALDAAQRLFESVLPLLAERPGAPEAIGRYGGAALVAESLVRAGRLGEETLHDVLREALVFAPDRLSLYDGAAGLLVVLDAVAADGSSSALSAARTRLRDALAASLLEPSPPDFSDPRTYDLISGVAGRAVALGGEAPQTFLALRAFAQQLAAEAERRIASDDPRFAATVNLGVSHGVPGMLAAINAALPDDGELADRYVRLLLACSHVVNGERRWDGVWRPTERPSPRRAWCYQTAGVATVLADRARLDGDDALHALAAGALRGVLDDPEPDDGNAALCHGRSGVATLASRFPGDPYLMRHARRLARAVLDDAHELARTSFLDGALGIAQFLIDAATGQERRWLRLFGLLPT
jgi:Lanthionine synthetase C-like protein